MPKTGTFLFMVGAALILNAGSAAQAATDPAHIQKSLRPETRAVAHTAHVHTGAAPVSLTQSVDPNTIEDNISVACSSGGITTSNTWMRRFDLDGDYGITGNFCASSLDFGIELLVGGTQLTVATHCYNANTPGFIDLAQLQTQDSVTFAGLDGSLYFWNAVVGGCCLGSTNDLVVEVTSADCLGSGACQQFFIGANESGQTAPSYLGAADCGLVNPTDLSLSGFPMAAVLMVVNSDVPEPRVPALGPVGGMILLLALLGASAIFLRRRVTG